MSDTNWVEVAREAQREAKAARGAQQAAEIALAAALKAKEEAERDSAEAHQLLSEGTQKCIRAFAERDEARAALRLQNDLALERLAEVERLRGALESAGKTATRLARSFRPGGAREAYVFKHDLDALASALASSTQTKGDAK